MIFFSGKVLAKGRPKSHGTHRHFSSNRPSFLHSIMSVAIDNAFSMPHAAIIAWFVNKERELHALRVPLQALEDREMPALERPAPLNLHIAGPPGGAHIIVEVQRKRPRKEDVIIISDDDDEDAEMDEFLDALVAEAVVDGEPVYEVEKIITMRDLPRGRQYLVKWVGYDKPTWVYQENLDGCQELVYEYWERRGLRRQHRRLH